jgi:hypothetical protein
MGCAIFVEELKPAVRIMSDARVGSASRPPHKNRPAYARSERRTGWSGH